MYVRGNRSPGAASLLMKMHSKTRALFLFLPLPSHSFRRGYPFLILLSSSAGRHSSMSFIDSRRMPHSRSTLRMPSAHRWTAAFSWSFSFCRTVAHTPSRPRTQGTDIYTSLSVPWEQLCKQRFLELVSPLALKNWHANKCVCLTCENSVCSFRSIGKENQCNSRSD